MPDAEFHEVRGDKTVRIKANQLSAFFWSRDNVCERYHTHESGDSEISFEEVFKSDFDEEMDSDEWMPDSISLGGHNRKRKRT